MRVVLLLMLLGTQLLHAQMSHAQLTAELLKDLKRGISDSTHLGQNNLQIEILGEGPASDYLNRQLKEAEFPGHKLNAQLAPVSCELLELNLSIHRLPEESGRNKSHERRLKLGVKYALEDDVHEWHGQTSDRLTDEEVLVLLKEDYPLKVSGDYKKGQPGSLKIILGSLSLFGALAALYFVRT